MRVFLFILLSTTLSCFAQVGIGTTSPDESSILDVVSVNKGFLPPRMTAQERQDIIDPSEGLIIYCTDCCSGSISFYNGTKWKIFSTCNGFTNGNFQNPSDYDLDGVPNSIDIDDDNDGLLDTDEGNADYDNDGLVNSIDLDSDGDGCSDAKEGGATTSTNSDYQFSNSNVGTNGLDNSLETNTDNGIINYTLNTNSPYNNIVNGCLNNAPIANTVAINGNASVGETLTGSYNYTDNESDSEGTSTFKWYRSDDNSGTNEQAISGANSTTYTLTSSDDNKYIRFGVTPVASSGTTTGTEVFSSYFGSITTPISVIGSNVDFNGGHIDLSDLPTYFDGDTATAPGSSDDRIHKGSYVTIPLGSNLSAGHEVILYWYHSGGDNNWGTYIEFYQNNTIVGSQVSSGILSPSSAVSLTLSATATNTFNKIVVGALNSGADGGTDAQFKEIELRTSTGTIIDLSVQ